MFFVTYFLQESVDIIRNHDKTKPLYLYIAFMALHAPLTGLPPKKFRKKFSRDDGKGKFEESPHEVRDIVLASVGKCSYFLIQWV